MLNRVWRNDRAQFLLGFFSVTSFLFVAFFVFAYEKDQSVVPAENVHSAKREIVRKELVIGSVGTDVIEVQNKLKSIDALDIEDFDEDERGFFGEQTQYYVTLFQLSQNITPHGRVDARTWQQLARPIRAQKEQIDQLRTQISLGSGFTIDDIYYAPQFQKVTFLTFRGLDDLAYFKKISDLTVAYDAQATFFVTPEDLEKFSSAITERESVFGLYVTDQEALDKSTSYASRYDLWCMQPSYQFMDLKNITRARDTGLQPIQWSVDPQNAYNDNVDMMIDHLVRYTQHYDTVSFDVSDESDENFFILLEKYLQKMQESEWRVLSPACG